MNFPIEITRQTVKSFSIWVQANISKTKQFPEIFQAFQEGNILVDLIQNLSGKKNEFKLFPKPQTKKEIQQNIYSSFKFAQKLGIPIEIKPKELFKKNSKYIIQIIWQLAVYFRLTKNNESFPQIKDRIIEWCNWTLNTNEFEPKIEHFQQVSEIIMHHFPNSFQTQKQNPETNITIRQIIRESQYIGIPLIIEARDITEKRAGEIEILLFLLELYYICTSPPKPNNNNNEENPKKKSKDKKPVNQNNESSDDDTQTQTETDGTDVLTEENLELDLDLQFDDITNLFDDNTMMFEFQMENLMSQTADESHFDLNEQEKLTDIITKNLQNQYEQKIIQIYEQMKKKEEKTEELKKNLKQKKEILQLENWEEEQKSNDKEFLEKQNTKLKAQFEKLKSNQKSQKEFYKKDLINLIKNRDSISQLKIEQLSKHQEETENRKQEYLLQEKQLEEENSSLLQKSEFLQTKVEIQKLTDEGKGVQKWESRLEDLNENIQDLSNEFDSNNRKYEKSIQIQEANEIQMKKDEKIIENYKLEIRELMNKISDMQYEQSEETKKFNAKFSERNLLMEKKNQQLINDFQQMQNSPKIQNSSIFKSYYEKKNKISQLQNQLSILEEMNLENQKQNLQKSIEKNQKEFENLKLTNSEKRANIEEEKKILEDQKLQMQIGIQRDKEKIEEIKKQVEENDEKFNKEFPTLNSDFEKIRNQNLEIQSMIQKQRKEIQNKKQVIEKQKMEIHNQIEEKESNIAKNTQDNQKIIQEKEELCMNFLFNIDSLKEKIESLIEKISKPKKISQIDQKILEFAKNTLKEFESAKVNIEIEQSKNDFSKLLEIYNKKQKILEQLQKQKEELEEEKNKLETKLKKVRSKHDKTLCSLEQKKTEVFMNPQNLQEIRKIERKLAEITKKIDFQNKQLKKETGNAVLTPKQATRFQSEISMHSLIMQKENSEQSVLQSIKSTCISAQFLESEVDGIAEDLAKIFQLENEIKDLIKERKKAELKIVNLKSQENQFKEENLKNIQLIKGIDQIDSDLI
ncbi:spectrin beta chain [Anaeramoeba ignava]|uniref:Spectrin beta chain n=1 Tax=Anaeramoeba ignava TaxID=1746090 RepID=A0A9Q0LJ52_ANAIG|nr:spectrin beta chain [Anaeramoeba ignava]